MFQNIEQARFYLAGVIDGEGSISMRPQRTHGAKSFTREVRITNTDERLLAASKAALQMLGVSYVLRDRSERERLGTKPIFDIIVSSKENLEILAAQLPLQTEKGEKLKAAVSSYTRRNRPAVETLQEHLAAAMTDKEIAALYEVTPAAVWFWWKYYELDRSLSAGCIVCGADPGRACTIISGDPSLGEKPGDVRKEPHFYRGHAKRPASSDG